MALSAARGRLVETVTKLFCHCGTIAMGGDTIVARSGELKPTRNAHFRTELDLVVAAPLARRARPKSP